MKDSYWENIETAPIPDDPLFKVKEMDVYVHPIMEKMNVEIDYGSEKVYREYRSVFKTNWANFR